MVTPSPDNKRHRLLSGWAYRRFEAMDDGVVADEVAGRRPLRATGGRLRSCDGNNRA